MQGAHTEKCERSATPSPRSLQARRASGARSLRGLVALLGLPLLALAGCEGGGAPKPTMSAAQAIELHADSLMALPGVVGVYEGESGGEPVLRVMMAERSEETERRIPRRLEGYRVEVEVTGRIQPMGQ